MVDIMAMTSAQRRAAQLAKLQAEQEQYEKAVVEAQENAAFARCKAVEELYELLEVKKTRNDKDETKRAEKLVEAIGKLVDLVAQQDSTESTEQAPARVASVPDVERSEAYA